MSYQHCISFLKLLIVFGSVLFLDKDSGSWNLLSFFSVFAFNFWIVRKWSKEGCCRFWERKKFGGKSDKIFARSSNAIASKRAYAQEWKKIPHVFVRYHVLKLVVIHSAFIFLHSVSVFRIFFLQKSFLFDIFWCC